MKRKKRMKTKKITSKRYGWKPQLPDHKDFLFKPAPAKKLPPKVDRLTLAISAWDQGELGSCTGHGIGRVWAHRWLQEGRPFVMPSRLFIYYNERVLEGTVNEDDGASIRDGMKVLSKIGVPHEDLWPYRISQFAKKPPKTAFDQALTELALQYHAVEETVDAMKAALAAGNPIVGGFNVFQSFMGADVATTGIMPMPGKDEKSDGGHCVCFDGYDDRDQTFWVANSWGEDWGQAGWFKMPYANILNIDDLWVLTAVK